MREIKFRGYAVEEMINSQWLYGFGVMDIDYVDGTVEWHLHTLNGTYEVYPKSIGQYTGLKDKNGREIYEGDILKGICPLRNEWVGNVKYLAPYYAILGKRSHLMLENFNDMRVIGNIYENPELLEGDN